MLTTDLDGPSEPDADHERCDLGCPDHGGRHRTSVILLRIRKAWGFESSERASKFPGHELGYDRPYPDPAHITRRAGVRHGQGRSPERSRALTARPAFQHVSDRSPILPSGPDMAGQVSASSSSRIRRARARALLI